MSVNRNGPPPRKYDDEEEHRAMIADYIAQESAGHGTAAPTDGSYTAGDIVYNDEPALDGYVGWVCTESGQPGTWEGFGTIGSTGGTISGGVTGVTGTAPIKAEGTNAPTLPATGMVRLSLENQGGAGFAAGVYPNANVAVNAFGLITAISAGNDFGISNMSNDWGATIGGYQDRKGGFVMGSGASAVTVNWMWIGAVRSGPGDTENLSYAATHADSIGLGFSDAFTRFREFQIPYDDTLWGDDKVPFYFTGHGLYGTNPQRDQTFTTTAYSYGFWSNMISAERRTFTNGRPYSRCAVDGPGDGLAMDTAVPTGSNADRGVACDYSGTLAIEPTGIYTRARGFYDPSLDGPGGIAAEARYALDYMQIFCIGGPPAI